jgi:hypothetical protein
LLCEGTVKTASSPRLKSSLAKLDPSDLLLANPGGDLVDALVARQSESGSWKNATPRWEEANEELATVYSVLALQEAIKPRVTAE